MDAASFKSFIEITKSIHENAKESKDASTNMMQCRINTLELKKGQLKTLLKDAKQKQDIACAKALQMSRQVDVYKSTLDIATKENNKLVAKIKDLEDANKGLREENEKLSDKNKQLTDKVAQLEMEDEEYEEIEVEDEEEVADKRQVIFHDQSAAKKPRTE